MIRHVDTGGTTDPGERSGSSFRDDETSNGDSIAQHRELAVRIVTRGGT